MKSNFFNRVVNLIAISKQKKIIEKNIIFFSMTFLEMAALFNFMFLMEMLIFFYKHQQKADHKESTGNPDHSDSIAYGQISTNESYRPGEIPKLEAALVEQQGASVLLVVANDLDAAKSVIE